MNRLFLDANVLFSAAYRTRSGLLLLWKLQNVILCSSSYALEEARINLTGEDQLTRITKLAETIHFYEAVQRKLPREIFLREKDVPTLLPARKARAPHLLTGDVRPFG